MQISHFNWENITMTFQEITKHLSVSRLILNICSTRIFEDHISLHDPWGWFVASLPWLDKMYSFSRMCWIREAFFKSGYRVFSFTVQCHDRFKLLKLKYRVLIICIYCFFKYCSKKPPPPHWPVARKNKQKGHSLWKLSIGKEILW